MTEIIEKTSCPSLILDCFEELDYRAREDQQYKDLIDTLQTIHLKPRLITARDELRQRARANLRRGRGKRKMTTSKRPQLPKPQTVITNITNIQDPFDAIELPQKRERNEFFDDSEEYQNWDDANFGSKESEKVEDIFEPDMEW